jgi:hypothetical protein
MDKTTNIDNALYTVTARISSSVKFKTKTDYEYKRDLELRFIRQLG